MTPTLCAATFSNSYVKWRLRYVILRFVPVPVEGGGGGEVVMRVYLLICWYKQVAAEILSTTKYIYALHNLQSSLVHINLPVPPNKMWKYKYDMSYTVQYFSMILSGKGPP